MVADVLVAEPRLTKTRASGVRAWAATVALAFLGATFAGKAQAIYVVPRWDQLVHASDFVGIAECVTAGVISARYRVVESWKGPPTGSVITIDEALDSWGPNFSLRLCGERYLIFAGAATRPAVRACFHIGLPGCGMPLWWRDAHAEYRTGPACAPFRLPPRGDSAKLHVFGFEGEDLRAARESVVAYVSLPDTVLEARRLRWYGAGTLYVVATRDRVDSTLRAEARRVAESVNRFTIAMIVDTLSEIADKYPLEGEAAKERILSGEGRERTLSLLLMKVDHSADPTRAWRARTIEAIEARLAPRPPAEGARRHPWAVRLTPPTEAEIGLARDAVFGRAKRNPSTLDAFEVVTEWDPDSALVAIANWHPESSATFSWYSGYVLASYFCWRQEARRDQIWPKLLTASAPIIRVVGAVYVSMNDSARGKAELRGVMTEPGFPGLWASTVLASTGDKSAASHAFQIFDISDTYEEREAPVSTLKCRLAALLSNSARGSGVELPPIGADLLRVDSRDHQAAVARLSAWWAKVQDRIALWDPWRPLFSAQGID